MLLFWWPLHAQDGMDSSLIHQSYKLLPKPEIPKVISLEEALSLALQYHPELGLIKNLHEQQKIQQWMNIGELLPKVSVGTSYTRNIPKKELSLFDAKQAAALNRHVAGLLRKASDNAAADQLEQQADLMMRRDAEKILITNPKDVFDAKLGLEVPVFYGEAIAKGLAGAQQVHAFDAKVNEHYSQTLFDTAQAYFLSLYLDNVVSILAQAQKRAEQALKQAASGSARYKMLDVYGDERTTAHQEGVLEYRTALAMLGLMLGKQEEFVLKAPAPTIFSNLPLDANDLNAMALQERWDLKAYGSELKALDYEQMGNYLSFTPNLWLGADARYTSNDRTLLGEKLTYALSINASLSLFDGGLSYFSLRKTGLKRSELLIKRDETLMNLRATITGSLERLAVLKRKAEASQKKQVLVESVSKKGKTLNQGQPVEDFIRGEQERITTAKEVQKLKWEINQEQLKLMKEAGIMARIFSY